MTDINKLSLNIRLLKDVVAKNDVHSLKAIKKITNFIIAELQSGVCHRDPVISQEHLDSVQSSVDGFIKDCSIVEHDNFLNCGWEKLVKLLRLEQARNSARLFKNLNDVSPIDAEAELVKFWNEMEIPQELLEDNEETSITKDSQLLWNPIIVEEDENVSSTKENRK